MICAASLREGAETCGYFGRRPCLENFLTSSPPTSARHYLTHHPPATHSDTQMQNALYIEADRKWRCTCPTSHPGPRPIRFPTRYNPRNQNTCNKQHNMKWKEQMIKDELLAKYETFNSYLILNKLIPKRAFDHFWMGVQSVMIIKTSKYLRSLFCLCVLSLSIDTVLVTIGCL